MTAPTSPVHPPQLPGSDRTPPPRTLIDVLETTVRAHPDAPALDDGAAALTYADLQERVLASARFLADLKQRLEDGAFEV